MQKPFKSRLKVNWQLWEEAIPAHTPQLTSAIGIWINPQKDDSRLLIQEMVGEVEATETQKSWQGPQGEVRQEVGPKDPLWIHD